MMTNGTARTVEKVQQGENTFKLFQGYSFSHFTKMCYKNKQNKEQKK